MDHQAAGVALEAFFAIRREAWARMLRQLEAAGADEELLLVIGLVGNASAGHLRVDVRGAFEWQAIRRRETAAMLDEVKRVLLKDALETPAA